MRIPIIAAVVALGLAACSSKTAAVGSDVAADADIGLDASADIHACTRPLADWCAPGTCPTYAAIKAASQAAAAQRGLHECWQSGMCGELQYIQSGGYYGDGAVDYFDSGGALVAHRRSTDVNRFCGGSYVVDYGPVPACTMTVEDYGCGQRRQPLVGVDAEVVSSVPDTL